MTARDAARPSDVPAQPMRIPDARGLARTGLTAAIALTVAGMIWIALGSMIAETGLRINQRVTDRQELLARRAAARLSLAYTTHPDTLDARARALGFGPRPDALALEIVVEPGSLPHADLPAAQHPFAFRIEARRAVDSVEPEGTLLGIFDVDEAAR